ncbi:hypothetical protein OESDEN_23522 [Oesophagostomum dentatum]|nr:hypothetical protein OESDEN_23522 [Oesophagostomum dentatum]
MLTCDCLPGTHVDYNLEAELLANQARICETVSLHLGVS